ncbi:hypothetical protein [Methanobacterium sp.]|uniref:hypothetical protein n=1 Tax=Methanobacterium sp. TaxID=2164 RepID=UPI0025D4F59A|nr:hypothetical protein [Methanobacterium sp.]MBI5460152.1 hypothetical protein [Methanobacterium sp.]MDY9924024.1 hypothetical protein [Methanobacterium sp.]
MSNKRKSKKKLGVKCQCQDPAVARPPSLLRKVQCKKCGMFFTTNRDDERNDSDICLNCRSRR